MNIDLKSYLMSNFPNTKYKNISLIYLYSLDNELYKSLATKGKIAPEAVDFFTSKSRDVKQIRSTSEVLRNMGYESLIDKYLKEQEAIQQKKLENQRRAEEEHLRKEEELRKAEEERLREAQEAVAQHLEKMRLHKEEMKRKKREAKKARKKGILVLTKEEIREHMKRRYEGQLDTPPSAQPVQPRYCPKHGVSMKLVLITKLRTQKRIPIYKCPVCSQLFMYTDRENEIREAISPCYVYKKFIPLKCRKCKKELIATNQGIKVAWRWKPLKYCDCCECFFVPYEMYVKSEQEWSVYNSDDLDSIKEEAEPEEPASLETEEDFSLNTNTSKSVKKLETAPIAFKDFIVRRSVFKCKNAGHRLQNITGIVKIMNHKGEIEDVHIPAGYCPNCDRYFIMENTYQALKSKGVILCRVSDEKSYLNSNGDYDFDSSNMAQKSILKQCGYSVSENSYLTSDGRKKLLCMIIDNGILRSSEVISYLDWFIRMRDGQYNLRNAIEKWRSDLDFIREKYSESWDKYRVSGIRR